MVDKFSKVIPKNLIFGLVNNVLIGFNKTRRLHLKQ